MVELTIDGLRAELRANTRDGEIFPSVIRLLAANNGWSGRVWEVLDVLAEDQETMRFIAGGNRPDEIADAAEEWAASTLATDQIRLVLRARGYDVEPFCILAKHGLFTEALLDAGGEVRRVNGERAGTWISDQLALATPEEIVHTVSNLIADQRSAEPTAER